MNIIYHKASRSQNGQCLVSPLDLLARIPYRISFKESDEKVAATFAGPSCDSLDIMFRGRMTAPLEVGDLLLVPSCGAYTSASATTFNGFSKARFVVWEKVQDIVGGE